MAGHGAGPTIGIIANPVSARDIRRVVANAANLQITDRVNIVLRLLAAAAAGGVTRALMMPDKGGIRPLLERQLARETTDGIARYPQVEFLDMPISSSVEDTYRAGRLLREAGVAAIVVLGGDGTHRALVRELMTEGVAPPPIAGLSTGTNNAFPEMREPTITGLAVGLFASGQLTAAEALVPNKLLDVEISAPDARSQHDIAIVDAVITTDRHVGARALWKPESLAEIYLAFADPEAIGLSAIGALLQPVGRREAGGLAIELAHEPKDLRVTLRAPIAPGLVSPVPIARWTRMNAGEPHRVVRSAGTVALDGERELAFDESHRVSVTLRENAFFTVDVARCMHTAAARGLFHTSSTPAP